MKSYKYFAIWSLLLFFLHQWAHGQQSIDKAINTSSSMDWYSSLFTIRFEQMVQPVGSNLSPSSHPRTLQNIEENFSALVQQELGRLAWNHQGNIGSLASSNAQIRALLENTLWQRKWSRLNMDGRSVEALYTLNIKAALSKSPNIIPDNLPATPLKWIPTPADPWTGLIIYVPSSMSMLPAIYPRIISEDANILVNSQEDFIISYLPLSERHRAEEIVGTAPYRTMARLIRGQHPCDIIISQEDAQRLLASQSGRALLLQGLVVILYDDS